MGQVLLTDGFDLKFHHVVHGIISPFSPIQVFQWNSAKIGLENAKNLHVIIAGERGVPRLIIGIDLGSDSFGSSMSDELRADEVFQEWGFLRDSLSLRRWLVKEPRSAHSAVRP